MFLVIELFLDEAVHRVLFGEKSEESLFSKYRATSFHFYLAKVLLIVMIFSFDYMF